MKKIFFIITLICSITSITNQCQNNLDQATQSILDNTEKLKEKLSKIQSEHNYQHTDLTIDDIQNLLIIQNVTKNSELAQTINAKKTTHQKLDVIATWFEEQKTIDDWINYFAIHNQMIAAIAQELEKLQTCPQLCQEIGQRIVQVLNHAIQNFYENNEKAKAMVSLIYIQEDYIILFQKYGFIKSYII